VPVVIVANLAVGRRWAHVLIALLAGLLCLITFTYGALDLAGHWINPGGAGQNAYVVDFGFMVTSLIASALISRRVRQRVSRIVPIDADNPVHALALVVTVILLGVLPTTTAFMNTAADQPALTVADLIANELPLLVIGVTGVGLFIRRNISEAAIRLGLVRPAWWQPVFAIAAAGLFYGFAEAMAVLSQIVTPEVTRQVDTTTQHLFGGLSGPVAIAAIALAPGICEEVLFRGALQPRIGLIATTLLFTAFHSQYGVSLIALSVLILGLGLGLIRKFTNTTTSSICHITFNFLMAISVSSWLVAGAIGIEAVLIAVSVYAIWTNRRRLAVAGDVLTTRVGGRENNE
jgi:membrane protease YdiL (CAAX protease family)